MDFELDPQVRHAVDHPAETVRGPEEVQLRIRLAGEPARQALGAHWAEAPADAASAAEDPDRLAAAVLLATLFDDRFWLEKAAQLPGDVPGSPSAPPRGLLELARVPGARAAMAPVLERPLMTGLLEWATKPVPEQPPTVLAEAARDLGIDDDGRVYPEVRRRAERLLSREYDGSPELERFVAVLKEAERRPRQDGPVISGEVLPGPQAPLPGPPPAGGTGAPRWGAPPSDMPQAPRWGQTPTPGQAPVPGQEPQPRQPVFGPPSAGPGVPDDDPAGFRNWGILGLVIVGIIVLLIFVL